jgi:tetratricopeptide (TPR) repeat protein
MLALVLTGTAAAQCLKLAEVNAEKPDGQLLQQIGQESDDAKKMPLLGRFLADYPKSEAAGWVLEQLQAGYIKSGNPDKILETGEKILALAPDCAESAHQSLKAAEAKKDPDLIRKWSDRASQAALKVMKSAKPADEGEAATWAVRVDWARQANIYTEYSLYAASLRTADPKQKIQLVETLEQRNPDSEYLLKAYPQLFLGYRQTGANDKALALAEKVVAKDQSDPDLLLVVASDCLAKKKDPEKVHAYTAKVAEVVAAQPKPEGLADADWQKMKGARLGAAHFMDGALYYAEARWPQTDKQLRAGLPHMTDLQMKAEALYYLGFANYKLVKAQEAAEFYRQCAAIDSRFQAPANKNLQAIKREYHGIK